MVKTPNFDIRFDGVDGQSTTATLNDLIRFFDTLTHPLVLDKDLTAPPGGESEGDTYIVGGSATGAWSGQDDDLAVYFYGTWYFVTPWKGFTVYVDDESAEYRWGGSSWGDTASTILSDNNTWTGTQDFQGSASVTGGALNVGKADTTAATVNLYPNNAGTGPIVYWYQPPDEDTTVDWQRIFAVNGNLNFLTAMATA